MSAVNLETVDVEEHSLGLLVGQHMFFSVKVRFRAFL